MDRPRSLPLYWFVYFGGLGVFFPYYSLYLRENAGLSGLALGLCLACFPLVALVAQPFWGQVADRTGARSHVLSIVSLGAALGYLNLGRAEGFVELFVAMALLALFATAVIPNAVSVSMAALRGHGPHAFARVRVWGSVGYLVMVLVFPLLLDWWEGYQQLARTPEGPAEPALGLIFPVTASLAFLASLVGFQLPRGGAVGLRAGRDEWRLLAHSRPFLRLLLFSFLAFVCVQGPIVLFPVYVRSIGGDATTVSRMWVLMLIVEIPIIAGAGAGLKRLGPKGLLLTGIAAGGVRWLVCGLTGAAVVIYPIQLLHGLIVTGILMGGPYYIESVVPEQLRSTAQSLYSMCGMGLGGIVSLLASSLLLERLGVAAVYVMGGVGGITLAVVSLWLLPGVHAAATLEEIDETPPGLASG